METLVITVENKEQADAILEILEAEIESLDFAFNVERVEVLPALLRKQTS